MDLEKNKTVVDYWLAAHSLIPEGLIFPLGIVAGILLLAYLVNLLLKLRSRKFDSNAKGWFGLAGIVTSTLLVILVVGMVFRVRLLIVMVAAVTLVPVLILAPEIAWMIFRDRREKRVKKD
jgi:hypothetical protein